MTALGWRGSGREFLFNIEFQSLATCQGFIGITRNMGIALKKNSIDLGIITTNGPGVRESGQQNCHSSQGDSSWRAYCHG
jgi:hypothetical protein